MGLCAQRASQNIQRETLLISRQPVPTRSFSMARRVSVEWCLCRLESTADVLYTSAIRLSKQKVRNNA
jgi:hypothetical protein